MPDSILTSQNIASLHFVHTLRAAYQRFTWIADPDFAHISDEEAWQKVRRDAHIAHTIELRQRRAAGLDWIFIPASDEPADKRAAEILTEIFETHLEGFHQGRFRLAEAIFRGDAWEYIETDRRKFRISGDEDRMWLVPTRLRHVDRWRFRLARDRDQPIDAPAIKTHWELFSVQRGEWEEVTDLRPWVRVVFQELEETLGYGRGLLQSMFFYWRAKEVALTQGLMGLERWAQGLVQYGIDGTRAGAVGKNNEEVVEESVEQLIKHRSEHLLITDKNDTIQVHDAAGTGHQMVVKFLEYFDTTISQLVLSSVLPSGGGSDAGSFARAQVEAETAESTFQSDRRTLSEALTRSLVRLIWNSNRNNIAALMEAEGLGMPRMPRFAIQQKATDDPEKNVQIIGTALTVARIPLPAQWVYDRIGAPMPTQNEEVIEPPPLPVAGEPPAGGVGLAANVNGKSAHHRTETVFRRVEGDGPLDFEHDSER